MVRITPPEMFKTFLVALISVIYLGMWHCFDLLFWQDWVGGPVAGITHFDGLILLNNLLVTTSIHIFPPKSLLNSTLLLLLSCLFLCRTFPTSIIWLLWLILGLFLFFLSETTMPLSLTTQLKYYKFLQCPHLCSPCFWINQTFFLKPLKLTLCRNIPF